MAKWKLSRQLFGNEEFTFSEGEMVTIGRGKKNKIILSGIVISREHCVLDVKRNDVFITDLMSSNGVFIGEMRILPNRPYLLKHSDIVGFGWTVSTLLLDIDDLQKYVFRIVKECDSTPLLKNIPKGEHIDKIVCINGDQSDSDILIECQSRPSLKRKLSRDVKTTTTDIKPKIENENVPCVLVTEDVIALSDTDSDIAPKISKQSASDQNQKSKTDQIKPKENVFLGYEALNVKQEYLGYDEEPIQITDDTDSESEQWLLRLSQSSPGKPFTKMHIKKEEGQENCSYSQLDDFVDNSSIADDDDDDFIDDLISIPAQPPEGICEVPESDEQTNDIKLPKQQDCVELAKDEQKTTKEISSAQVSSSDDFPIKNLEITPNVSSNTSEALNNDVIDGFASHRAYESVSTSGQPVLNSPSSMKKKALLIDPLVKVPKKKPYESADKTKSKVPLSKHDKVKVSSDGQKLTSSQKEERKMKLKELALKGKKDCELQTTNNLESSSNRLKARIRITASNRGAFLTSITNSKLPQNDKNTGKKDHKSSNHKDNNIKRKSKSHDSSKESLKKTVTHVSPPPITQKKSVRFSPNGPQVKVFDIEPGNRMKKTSLVKATLANIRQAPVFSLEKITLMRILRWNPSWLTEQINNTGAPPILGHHRPPMAILHSFRNHSQYVQIMGDLLLMEIWECLSLAYLKLQSENQPFLKMRIASLPPLASQDHYCELIHMSVDVSIPASEKRCVPRVGEVILVNYGPENERNQRFFFVHSVKCRKSPPNQLSYYSMSLYATFTDKMKHLKSGELIYGKTLAYIHKELRLFEVLEYFAGSPLCRAILKPEPQRFPTRLIDPAFDIKSQFTMTLNDNQQLAVKSSVLAAIDKRPSIQMVQGPPGTGKSSVICAIVMTHLYNPDGTPNRKSGNILICATSNAAVDELVIRLLNIRKDLPKPERFRMVRVGREEAMHPRAREVSSQQLASRDVTCADQLYPPSQAQAAAAEEILHLEAKINMWKTATMEAKDPVREAYCETQVGELMRRLKTVLTGVNGRHPTDRSSELFEITERRIIEGANIIVTTLGSAHSRKLTSLKGRIALCIVDEAGQAIEVETLIPLTLDVTRLTLIGDPQQLPGYICSQRAKKYGLNESLFSRLATCTENWGERRPLVLLNQQYRMHSQIIDYPNRAFYDSKILTPVQKRPCLKLLPYSILSIPSGDRGQDASGANATEAWGAARLAAALARRLHGTTYNFAVLTPYNAHKELIKKCLLKLSNSSLRPVEVNTVDSFQGQERDVVLVSLARSQGVGFLTDTGRMNVMLTRAKHMLVICLNPHALLNNPQWRTLIEDAQRRCVYRNLPFRKCQPLPPDFEGIDDILECISNNELPDLPH